MKLIFLFFFFLLILSLTHFLIWRIAYASRDRFKFRNPLAENKDNENNPILLYHKIEDRWEWGIP